MSINGTCLTIVSKQNNILEFDVVAATMDLTNLQFCNAGSVVNVERSVRFGDEIGGHLLSGHVSGMAEVWDVFRETENYQLKCRIHSPLMKYFMPKGFVALNGVSLTIAEIDRGGNMLAVNLIPETLKRTNLSEAQAGTRLNLEVDAMTQAVVETVSALWSKEPSCYS